MKVQKYNSNPNFTSLYVNSKEAEKLLKKADRIVKASRDVVYLDINIPEGHRIPLWSVLSEQVQKRQQNNTNDIVIDVAEKGKSFLSVAAFDTNGFLQKKWVVNPMPVIGTMEQVMPQDTVHLGRRKSFSKVQYGRSPFFDVMDSAEALVDILLSKETSARKARSVSLRALPKENQKNKTKEKAVKPKKILEHKMKELNVQHVQRPFIALKDMVLELVGSSKIQKLEPKQKEKLPRHLKKELKKQALKSD